MDLEEYYEIALTAAFIQSRYFSIVALQFPDELLKDATRVVQALRDKLGCGEASDMDVRLYVMADTTYGSCCVDEVGAAHINAHCVIHYGHTCLSPTSTLPALYIFGKAPLNMSNCAENLTQFASTNVKPVLVLFGLEYSYAIPNIREAVESASSRTKSACKLNILCADVICSVMEPSVIFQTSDSCHVERNSNLDSADSTLGTRYTNAGLSWCLPDEHKMEDYLIYWIGSDNSAFAHVVLEFNGCEIDSTEEEEEDGTHALVRQTEKALTVRDKDSQSMVKGTSKSGAEFFAKRSFQGLEIPTEYSSPGPVLMGRTGKASGYAHEKINNENVP